MSSNHAPKSTAPPRRQALLPTEGGGPENSLPTDPEGGTVVSAAPDVPEVDPFDPARLRLSQDFASAVGVRKLLTTVPVRKPDKSWWVRTHADPAYRLQTGLLELREEGETYLVDPTLWAELATEPTFTPQLLVTSINRQGVLFLWPVKLPGPDGKVMEWHRSAMEAADVARSSWTRVYADMSLGAYRVDVSEAIRTEPNWPPIPMCEVLRTAFREKLISTWDHPVLQRLRGES